MEIERAIMKRVDDGCCMANNEENDEVDGGYQEIIPKAEAYIRRLYSCLKGQEMVSANECVLSGYFGCRQQCFMGVCVFAYWCLHCFMVEIV